MEKLAKMKKVRFVQICSQIFISVYTETTVVLGDWRWMGMIEKGTDNIYLHSVAKITLQKGERRRNRKL